MKMLIVLIVTLAAGHCSGQPLGPVAAVNTGSSSQYRSQDNLGQYSFGYDEAGATGGSFRHEKSDAYGNRVGSYGLSGADGRVRIVNYVADANGYRASVQTNEPGTEPRDAAAVSMNRGPVAVALAAPGPVALAAPAPAPVALAAPVSAPVALASGPLPAPLAAPVALTAAPAPAYVGAPAPLSAPLPAPLPVPLPVYGPAAPVLGYGFSIVNHHLAPLPVAY